jgi:hypothetical protein
MSLYPQGHAPFVPRYESDRELVQWIAEMAQWTEPNRVLYSAAVSRYVAASNLEVLRWEQLSGTEPLPAQQDGISRLPADIRALLQTLKAAQQCLEEWLEAEMCLAILAKYSK